MSNIISIVAEFKDNASKSLGGVTSAISGLGGVASTVATGGLALVAAGVAAIGAAGVVAGKKIWDFTTELNDGLSLSKAQLGLTTEEVDKLRDSAKNVFTEGFGEGMDDVLTGMTEVQRVTGLTGEELETATGHALTLAKTFEMDVAESIAIADSVVQSGLVNSITEANDLLTTGFQMGLTEDWGDTLNEYSSDFARLGFTGEETLAIINAGMEAGAYNTDVVADGFREMGIRLMEGGDDMSAVFDTMGMDFDRMQGFIASGDETWGDYTNDIVAGLMSIDSEVERNAAGAAIFGTKWEDVGADVFLAAGSVQEGVAGISGATTAAGEALDEGFAAKWEKLKRTVIANLEPVGKVVTDILDEHIVPIIEKATEWVGENLPEGLAWLEEKWNENFPKMKKILQDFWYGIKPGIDWIREQFQNYTANYLPKLKEAWDTLGVGIDVVKIIVVEDLLPALADLSEALGLGELNVDGIGGAIGDLAGDIVVTGVKALILGIVLAVEGVALAAKAAKWWIDQFKRGLEGVKNVIRWVKDRAYELKDALASIGDHVPSWLIPGSPTPFEVGLRGIADAAKAAQGELQMNISGGQMPISRGGVTVVNNFGRDSVRSDDDIIKIADEIARRTKLRTGGAWL